MGIYLQSGIIDSILTPHQKQAAIMKNLLLMLIFGTTMLSCNNDTKEAGVAKNSDWTAQNLKGMVQSMESTNYTPDSTGKTRDMDSCCITVDEFDKNGYISATTKKDSKGNITENTTMVHYDKGQMKSLTTTKNGKPFSGFEIQIDKDGKYTTGQETDSVGETTFFFTGIKEDDYGAVTTGTRHKADSTVDEVFENDYAKGMQVAGRFKDSSGKEVYNSKRE